MKGYKIADMNYKMIEEKLTEDSIVVLPIGGGAKEHGNHLPYGTDLYVTNALADRVCERAEIMLLPTLPYAYFPAFTEWKGTVSIDAFNFANFVKDILKCYIKFGIKKFLILDGGVSTHIPLKIVSSDLHGEFGVTVAVTDIIGLGREVEDAVCEQKMGGHADEAETSCMLALKPELVKMEDAVEEYGSGMKNTVVNGVRRIFVSGKMETKNGTHGNSTLATKEKGEKLLEAMADDIVNFLEKY
jgi:creatinine amidohydrolase